VTEQSVPPRRLNRLRLVTGAAVAAMLAVLAGIYGIGGLRSNPDAAACAGAVKIAGRIAPLARGEVAALTLNRRAFRVPDLAFNDVEGRVRRLAEWRGRTVLFNLWATWCVPCRKEMPALDALEGELGGQNFQVVAVNIDTRDLQKPLAFLKEVGASHLAYYSDPSAKAFQDLKLAGRAFGMPTTLIVDPSGCEIGEMAGPAQWASADALRLVSAAIAGDGSNVTQRR
jgi:thiol-disulfide isomerase/thioredoxin